MIFRNAPSSKLIMGPHLPLNGLFGEQLVQLNNKDNIKNPNHWPIQGKLLVIIQYPPQRPAMRKAFPGHYVIME